MKYTNTIRKTTVLVLLLIVTIGAAMSLASPAFSDVPENYWGYPYIERAYSEKVIEGTYYNEQTGERRFSPESNVTAAQFATIILRKARPDRLNAAINEAFMGWDRAAMYASYESCFDEAWRVNSSIYSHGSDKMTRSQMALYMIETLKNQQLIDTSDYDISALIAKVKDGSSVGAQYKEAVALSYELGLITGFDDGSFQGDNLMTRAQAATVYTRFSDLYANLSGKAEEHQTSDNTSVTPDNNTDPSVNKDEDNTAQVEKCFDKDEIAQYVLQYVNEERSKKGLGELYLVSDSDVVNAANTRAKELAESFSHTRPNGEKWSSLFPIKFKVVRTGENIIAARTEESAGSADLAKQVVTRWVGSSGHYTNMVNADYKGVAIGVFMKDGTDVVYIVNNFTGASGL